MVYHFSSLSLSIKSSKFCGPGVLVDQVGIPSSSFYSLLEIAKHMWGCAISGFMVGFLVGLYVLQQGEPDKVPASKDDGEQIPSTRVQNATPDPHQIPNYNRGLERDCE